MGSGNEIAMNGDLEALTNWFKGLSKEEQLMLHNKGISSDLKNICNEKLNTQQNDNNTISNNNTICLSEEQIDTILELLKKQNKITPKQVLEIYSVETFQEIPLNKFDIICNKIQEKIDDTSKAEIEQMNTQEQTLMI